MDSSPAKAKLRAKLANKNKFSKLSLKSRQHGSNKENNHPVRSIKKNSFDSDLMTSDESENSLTNPLRSSILSNIQEPTSSLPIAESTRYEVLSVNPTDMLESTHPARNSSSSSTEYFSACPIVGCDESIVCLSDSYSESEQRVRSTKTKTKIGNYVKSESLILSSDGGNYSPTKEYSYETLNGPRKGKEKKLCDTVIIFDSSDEERYTNQREIGCDLVIPCSPRSTSDVSSSRKQYSSTEEPIKDCGLVIPPSSREDSECLSAGSIISEDNTNRKFGENSKDTQNRKSSFGSFVCSSVVDIPFSNQRKAKCQETTILGKESLLVEANQSSWQEDSRLVNPDVQESNCEKDEVSPTMPKKLSSEEAAGSLSKQKYKDIARWLFSGEESSNSPQTVDTNVEKDPSNSDMKYPQKNKVPNVRRCSSGSDSDNIFNPSIESAKRKQGRKPKKVELDSFIIDSDASDVTESPSISMYHVDLTRSIKAEVKSAKKEARCFGVRKNLYHSNDSDSELSDTNSISSSPQIKGTSPFKSLRKPNRLISSSEDSDSEPIYKKTEKKWTFQDERDLQITNGKEKGHLKKAGKSADFKKKVGSIVKEGCGSSNSDSSLDKPSKHKPTKRNDATWRQCDVSSEGSSSDSAKFQYPVPRSLFPKTSRKKQPTQSKPDCKRIPPVTPKRIAALKSPGTPYSPIRTFLSSLSGPTHQPGVRDHPEAAVYNKNFKTKKEELTRRLFKLFNREVFDSKLPQDMIVEWKPRLIRTAGLCYCKLLRQNGVTTRSAKIALSLKVNTSPDRLRDTLIHEMCHAAVWLLNNVSGGHGPFWKAWASKAMKRFPELPSIQRCHSYNIETKFTYRCTQCGYSFGRHSKSLDLNRKRCGYCYGTFEVLVSGKTQSNEEKVLKTPKAPSAFALFVKENYGLTKQANGGMKHGDIMKKLGEKFSTMKIQKP